MTAGPANPQAQLAAAVTAIAANLPAEQGELLGLPRFGAERAALARLSNPAWATLGAQACTPAEAQRLLDLARSRHAHMPRVTDERDRNEQG